MHKSNSDSTVKVPYERSGETELSLVQRRAQILILGVKITLISSLCTIKKQIKLPSGSSHNQLSCQHTEIRGMQQKRVGNVKNYDNALKVPQGGSSRKGLQRQQNQ